MITCFVLPSLVVVAIVVSSSSAVMLWLSVTVVTVIVTLLVMGAARCRATAAALGPVVQSRVETVEWSRARVDRETY